jgi:hypothetical protein
MNGFIYFIISKEIKLHLFISQDIIRRINREVFNELQQKDIYD